jgi:hypothetical protein
MFAFQDNALDFGVVALLFGLWWMWLRARFQRTSSWPNIEGRVESGEVTVVRGKSGESATATISYSYHAEGEYYAGYHVAHFGDEQKAWDYVGAMKGRTVQVRYHPRKPEYSVLRAEDQVSY